MRIVLLLCMIALSIANTTMAQQSDIRFARLSVEQGLSQSTVKCILKDKKGYMWFGTRDGLNRYDGYHFTIFKHNSGKKESLSSNYITDLLEDKAGNLWVGTVNGFNKYDPATESFQRYLVHESSRYVADLFQDSKGNIWVGTNGGLYIFDVAKGNFKGYKHDPANPNSLVDSGINKIIEDHAGNLWIATPLALERYNPSTQVFTHFQHDTSNKKSVGLGFLTTVFQDSQQRIWVATTAQGISLFNPKDNSFTRFQYDPAKQNSLSYHNVLSLAEDNAGNLWIGTDHGGISVFNYEKNTFKTYTLDINNPTSVGGISIHSLYKDDIGNMWVGTWAGGVSLWSRYGDKFIHYPKILDINSTNIYAIMGDVEGTIWIGIEDGGLVGFNPQKKEFKKYPNENQTYIETNVIISIAELNKDTLAIGYHIGGFAFFNKVTGKFTHFLPDPANPKSIFGQLKSSLLKDRNNALWIGDWGGGLSLYDKKNNGFINYKHNADDPHALSNGVVFAIFEDTYRNLWLGTEGGLNRLDRNTNQFIRYQHNDRDKQSISHNAIYCIFEDKQGRLWIGTGEGLNLFNRATKTFTTYREKDGLPNAVINSILEDEQGNLWLGTNKGLCRFNPRSKACRNYDIKEGLQSNEFNRNACYKAPDGTLYFAGTKGFNLFNPSNIRDNPYIAPVVLTDLQVFNESVVVGAKDSTLRQSIGQTKELTLTYNQSVITFHYAALNFTTPSKNRYACQLVGFDKAWNYVGNKRLATYTNLEPGSYTFRVKASNNDGIWNEQGVTLLVHVLPPWWQTWWFKTLVTSTLIGLIVGYSYSLNSKNKHLESLVIARTLELQQANYEINDKNKELVSSQEEINVQNEELLSANDDLVQSQEEVAAQRDMLAKQNKELLKAQKVIQGQNKAIRLHNQTLDQEVKAKTRELVDYNQQLEQFAFIAAHNLRAPVARILGLGEVLKLPEIAHEEEKMLVGKLIFTAVELDQVVRDINTILEIRKNGTLTISEINLTSQLIMLLHNLESEITATQAEIIEDFSSVNSIQTVKPYLDSILFNLIHNAIKYRKPGHKPCIRIKAESSEEYVCLVISDNGLGIDLISHRKNLFTLYKRFHSHVEGKGMGLYLVKTQVVALGGKIEVESEVNKGTTFKVFLKKMLPNKAIPPSKEA